MKNEIQQPQGELKIVSAKQKRIYDANDFAIADCDSKETANRIVKAVNILSAIEKKICLLDDFIVDAGLNAEGMAEYNCLKNLLQQSEGK